MDENLSGFTLSNHFQSLFPFFNFTEKKQMNDHGIADGFISVQEPQTQKNLGDFT